MTKKPNNIHSLPNASDESLEVLKRLAPDVIAQSVLLAEMRYANYRSHIKAGFTEAQALELCSKLSFS